MVLMNAFHIFVICIKWNHTFYKIANIVPGHCRINSAKLTYKDIMYVCFRIVTKEWPFEPFFKEGYSQEYI